MPLRMDLVLLSYRRVNPSFINANHALPETGTQYAQIEKEMFAVVFAKQKFDQEGTVHYYSTK